MFCSVFVNYFSLSLKRLYKESYKGGKEAIFIQRDQLGEGVTALFYPELLSESALDIVRSALSGIDGQEVHIFSYFCSVWILQELKDHPLFKHLHFYTLSLNDKLREFPILQVMDDKHDNNQLFTLEACTKSFF